MDAIVGNTLYGDMGTWTSSSTISYARQWLRNGVPISGAITKNYQVVKNDIGYQISQMVTATNAVGSTIAYSLPTAAVVPIPVAPKSGTYVPLPQFFASTSFWNTKIPVDAPLHANNANFVTEFLRQKAAYYGTVNINVGQFSLPIYIAPVGTPLIKVTNLDLKTGTSYGPLQVQIDQVPWPEWAIPSADNTLGTGDREIIIYSPSLDTMWEFWIARRELDGTWTCAWGGRITNVSTDDGIVTNPFGVLACGVAAAGGLIKLEEIQAGVIPHGLGIALVDVEHFTTFSWPANRSDGYNPTNVPNRIAEGQRFRLNPAVNVSTLPMNANGKIIAKAIQDYGCVVWDKGGAIALRAVDPKSYAQCGISNPYSAVDPSGNFGGSMTGFPWDQIQFLPMDYGRGN